MDIIENVTHVAQFEATQSIDSWNNERSVDQLRGFVASRINVVGQLVELAD